MKKVALVVVLLGGIAYFVHAQTQGPSVTFITVTTAGGCPTPTLSTTGTVWQLCGAPDGVYVSVVNSPTPAKIGGPSGFTSLACTTSNLASGSGLAASGCTEK